MRKKEMLCIEVKCVAEMLGVWPTAIYNAIYEGRLPCVRFKRRRGQDRIGIPVEVVARRLGVGVEEVIRRAWELGYPVWRCEV